MGTEVAGRIGRAGGTLLLVVALWTFDRGIARATGDWSPDPRLGATNDVALSPPAFFFELEMKDLASRLSRTDPRALGSTVPSSRSTSPELTTTEELEREVTRVDLAEFDAAIGSGYVKASDPSRARESHRKSREAIMAGSALPAEEPSEFADYHQGAWAYRRHDLQKARAGFDAVLARPAAARRYRTVWAAFMLGRIALDDPAAGSASELFRRTRALAAEGFPDSLGLVADSFGWEARVAVQRSDYEQAVRLYLLQLAGGGGLSALHSLKLVMRGFTPALGVTSEELPASYRGASTSRLGARLAPLTPERVAADPILRQVYTAYLLGRGDELLFVATERDEQGGAPSVADWLATLERANVTDAGEAVRIAWLCYQAGRFDTAGRFLALGNKDDALARWLSAKLDLRAGRIVQGRRTLEKALPALMRSPARDFAHRSPVDPEPEAPAESALSDMATLELHRGRFPEALRLYFLALSWQEAAYVAERVLETDELAQFVKTQLPTCVYPSGAAPVATESRTQQLEEMEGRLHQLLGRRLVREERFSEALAHFPEDLRTHVGRYATLLSTARGRARPARERAKAFEEAARLIRERGMKILATELGPDGAIWGGNHQPVALHEQRLGMVHEPPGEPPATPSGPVRLPVAAAERKRLRRHGVSPEKRWHHRYVAADLAWKGARMMVDQTEELAHLLNDAGWWVAEREHDRGWRFFRAIESRCGRTELGRQVLARKWFVHD